MRIDGIILAAGFSSRMGRNKLLLPYAGKPLLQHAIDLVASLPLASRILVTTPATAEGVSVPDDFLLLCNDDPGQGQSSSMRLGLSRATGDAGLFFLGDQPLLDRRTVELVLRHAAEDMIVVPSHAGRPGNPVLFPARFKEELMAVRGDRAGRDVREAHPESCLFVEVENPDALLDVDTPEQYRKLLS